MSFDDEIMSIDLMHFCQKVSNETNEVSRKINNTQIFANERDGIVAALTHKPCKLTTYFVDKHKYN